MYIVKIICLLFLVICCFTSSCDYRNQHRLPSGPRAEGFQLSDKSKNAEVLKIMKERGIPYTINSRGLTIYMLNDFAKVEGIIRDVRFDGKLSNSVIESEAIFHKDVKKKLISSLKKAGVPYSLGKNNGVEFVYWMQVYGPKVDIIRQKIKIDMSKEAKREAVVNGKIASEYLMKSNE